MKLNKYLFNTVNNKERRHGQWSVVWLKHLQQLHVPSTVFSWWPFSLFSLWIILLPSDSCCFLLFVQTVFFFFLRCLRLRLVFCAIVVSSYFGATILAGRSSLRLAMVFCLGVSSAISWFESSTTALLWFFSRDGLTVVLRSLA